MSLDISLFYFFNNLAGQSSWGDWLIVFLASSLPYILIIVFLGWVAFSAYSRREQVEILVVVAVSGTIARLGATEL